MSLVCFRSSTLPLERQETRLRPTVRLPPCVSVISFSKGYASCFLSLLFRRNYLPSSGKDGAAYFQYSYSNILNAFTLQQILNHMNESAVYNETDLVPFHKRLSELRQIVQQDGEHAKHPKSLTKLLERQLNECGTPTSILFEVL